MIAASLPELHAWRCANPECPSRRTGAGQIILRGLNRPGFVAEGLCHQCHCYTRLQVTPDGVEYNVRPARNTING